LTRDAILEQDVGRLDVPVDQSGRVGRVRPTGELPADPHDLRRFQRAGAVEPLRKGFAGDELHHQVRQLLFPDGMHLDDRLVRNCRGRPGLAQEPLAGR
jgi:hypothetical protein